LYTWLNRVQSVSSGEINEQRFVEILKIAPPDPNFIKKKNIITGDETWAYPVRRFSRLGGKQNVPLGQKKARYVKTMLIVFLFCFDIEGIVQHEFVPGGQTVNQVFYEDVSIRSREKIRKKRPAKRRTGTWWFFHHGHAPQHVQRCRFVNFRLIKKSTRGPAPSPFS